MKDKLAYVASEVRENYDSLNWWRQRVLVPYVFGTLTRLHPRYPGYDEAVHVMEEDWDNLIVLDACRADVFEEVADLDAFDEYESVVSLGSHSSEWHRRNFTGGEFGDTVLVSGNPHSAKLAGDSFHDLVAMWERDFDDAGTVLPEHMASAAREAHEDHPEKRLIVHFMQPHGPFVGSDLESRETPKHYWQAYRDTLEYVLEPTLELAHELPGRTVFTADHGQIRTEGVLDALGLNNHPAGLRYPALVRVPWAVVEGDSREISEGSVASVQSDVVDDRLRDLGYKV